MDTDRLKIMNIFLILKTSLTEHSLGIYEQFYDFEMCELNLNET